MYKINMIITINMTTRVKHKRREVANIASNLGEEYLLPFN